MRAGKLAIAYDNKQLLSATSLSSNTWHHVALSYQSGQFVFYLNGNRVHSVSGSPPQTTSGPLVIGAAVITGLTGIVDDILLFPRALSEQEVRAAAGLSTEVGND